MDRTRSLADHRERCSPLSGTHRGLPSTSQDYELLTTVLLQTFAVREDIRSGRVRFPPLLAET